MCEAYHDTCIVARPSLAVHLKCFPSHCDFALFSSKIAYVSGGGGAHPGKFHSLKYASARLHVTPYVFNSLKIWNTSTLYVPFTKM